eukprot:jgi/Botrbrau1/8764/Bobra.0090s0035.2
MQQDQVGVFFSQTEEPDHRGRNLGEVWQLIQDKVEGKSAGRTSPEPSTGAKKQIATRGHVALEAPRLPVVGRPGYPTVPDAVHTLLSKESPFAVVEGGLDSGRPAGNAKSESLQVIAMNELAGGPSALGALPHSQDRVLPYQPLLGRNSSPTSSAESHPGSSAADLSHEMSLTSTSASIQDIPNPGGETGRGWRQRKRKAEEETDERTSRRQKRMSLTTDMDDPMNLPEFLDLDILTREEEEEDRKLDELFAKLDDEREEWWAKYYAEREATARRNKEIVEEIVEKSRRFVEVSP